MPLRLDVFAEEDAEEDGGLKVKAWETYRGNDWDNKGEPVAVTVPDGKGTSVLEARVLGGKGYFMERSKCLFALSFPLSVLNCEGETSS